MKLRRLLILATLAGLLASFALWGSLLFGPLPTFKPHRAPLNPLPKVDHPNLAIVKLLTSQLPANATIAGQFEPAVRRLTESVGHCQTEFRWNALRAAGVTPYTPVSLDASNRLFPNALDAILEQATRGPRLKFAIDGNTFIISTDADLSTAGTIWTFDISSLRDWENLDRMGFPGPVAAHVTTEVQPGTWVDAGQRATAGVSGHNPRNWWPDTAPNQGFVCYLPGILYVSHSQAAVDAIPPVLRELLVRQNRITFLDESLRLTGWCVVGAFIVHSLLRLRRQRPRFAALLLAHTVASYVLGAWFVLLFHYRYPSRQDLYTTLWQLVPPVKALIDLAHATAHAMGSRGQAFEVWAVYLVPLVIVYAICRRRFAPKVPVNDGRCVNCGYDLRATPDRCPECGTPVVTAPVPI